MAGVIFFNPIFGRTSIPSMVKVGLSLGIALNISPSLTQFFVADYTTFDLMLSLVKEFAVGYSLGFVMNLFLAVFHVGGELMDLQMGFSMAQMYDPSTNSNISVTGNLITILYTMIFFVTNSHLTLIGIASKSYMVVPIGLQGVSSKIAVYFIELFGNILVYAVQLSLPILVMEILVEVAVGILMKVVPNINVFVVNLQLKVMVGMVVVITIIPILAVFLNKLNTIMLEKLGLALSYLVL